MKTRDVLLLNETKKHFDGSHCEIYLDCSNGFTDSSFSECCHFTVATKCCPVIMTEYSDHVCFKYGNSCAPIRTQLKKTDAYLEMSTKIPKKAIPNPSGGGKSHTLRSLRRRWVTHRVPKVFPSLMKYI